MLASPPAPAAKLLPNGANQIDSWFHRATTLLVTLSRDGVVVQANASAVRYAGGDALVGSPLWETRVVAQSPASRAAVRAAVAAAFAGTPTLIDVERCAADGVSRTAEFTLTALPGGSALLAEGRDVTRRRAGEPRRQDLLGAASRELRTPLSGMRGALAMLESEQLGQMGPRARDLLHLARANAELLSQCLTDLIDLERIRSGTVVIEPIPTTVAAIGRTAVEVLTPLAVQRGVRLTARDDSAGRAVADHDHTAQALATILSHAVSAAPPGAALRVVAAKAGAGRVRLTVEDPTGVIATEHRAAFVRQLHWASQADASTAPPATSSTLARMATATATGPGLALARALVEQQGGSIGASAEADRTTLCWVELPAADPLVLIE